jgi:predicted nuclease with TOPRIM domain
MELEKQIQTLKEEIEKKQALLKELEEKWKEYKAQQEERERYVSSKEIIDYVMERSGKTINMSTIKRWTDEGYLGDVVDERDHFWALKTKQGKKRNLYSKEVAFMFLYQKGYIAPYYEILDEVVYCAEEESYSGVVVDVQMRNGSFLYTIQLADYTLLHDIDEKMLVGVCEDGKD